MRGQGAGVVYFGSSCAPGTVYFNRLYRSSCYARKMARLSRIVIPQVPHHVTQRGNRRLPVFFRDEDRHAYLALVADAAQA